MITQSYMLNVIFNYYIPMCLNYTLINSVPTIICYIIIRCISYFV